MKYIAPEFATIVVEAEDIILASAPSADENVTTPKEEL